MITAHLPALQVVVPLVAAPVCVLLKWSRLSWLVAMAASLFAVAGAWSLLARTLAEGPTSYLLGSWAAPWGIEYRVDETNAWVMLVVSVISAAALLFARRSVEREVETDRIHLFYTAWLLCLAGAPRDGGDRRRLQRLRVPRDLLALVVRAGQPRHAAPGPRRGVSLSRPRHRRGHLLPHRRGPPLPGDRDPQHGGPRRADPRARSPPHGHHRVRIPRRRHRGEERGLSAPHLAAQRLCLRSVRGLRLSRRHRDEGVPVPAAQVPVHGIRARVRGRRAGPPPARADGHRRTPRRVRRRHAAGRREAPSRLLERGPDRISRASG